MSRLCRGDVEVFPEQGHFMAGRPASCGGTAPASCRFADLEAVLEPEQREKLDKLLLPPKHMMRHMRQMRR